MKMKILAHLPDVFFGTFKSTEILYALNIVMPVPMSVSLVIAPLVCVKAFFN